MKNLNKILAGALAVLGIVAVAGATSVNAEATTFYNAVTEDTTLSAAGTLKENDDIKITTDSGMTAKSYTLGSYTKCLITSGNGKGITIEAKNDISVSVFYGACDGSKLYDSTYTFGTKTGDVSKTAVNSVTETLSAGEKVKLTTGKRVALYEVKYEAVQTTKYDVAFDFNYEGCVNAAATKVADGKTISAPTAPTRDGYTFDGWYANASCTGDAVTFPAKIEAATTYYAKWTVANVYKVTYHVGTTTNNVNLNEGSAFTVKPELALYESFAGWSTVENDKTKIVDVSSVTSNLELYPIIDNNNSQVVDFYALGVNANVPTETTAYESDVKLLKNMSMVAGSAKVATSPALTVDGKTLKVLQCGGVKFTLTETSQVTVYATQTNATNTRVIKMMDANTLAVIKTEQPAAKPSSATTANSTAMTVTLPAGSYELKSFDGESAQLVNYYGLKLEKVSDVNLNANAASGLAVTSQFDTANAADATAVRIVAKFVCTDLTAITAAELELTATKTDNSTVVKHEAITSVYTAIDGICSAADNTYYFVLEITGINEAKYDNVKLDAKLKLTVGGADLNASMTQITIA